MASFFVYEFSPVSSYITCKKFQTILISDKKVSENKTVRNFYASEILHIRNFYSTV